MLTLSTAAERAYAEGRWIDAARLYERLTRAVPGDAYAWFRLGNTYARQGEHERAVGAYEASVSRERAQPKAWFNLSTTYLLSAREALRRAGSGLRREDPGRAMIAERLRTLGTLLPDRFEEERGPGLPAVPGAPGGTAAGFEPVLAPYGTEPERAAGRGPAAER